MRELISKSPEELLKIAEDLVIANNKELVRAELIEGIVLKSSGEKGAEVAFGELEILADGYGFLRRSTFGSDIYISASQIKKFSLREGDRVGGELKAGKKGDKNRGLSKLLLVNGILPEDAMKRPKFDDLVPRYPNQQLKLERGNGSDIAERIIDMFAPLGRGQRGLVVAPPKAGKTILIKDLANSIIANHHDVDVWMLLIDERPEEVTDIRESVKGAKVFSSTFDEDPHNHIRVVEGVLEKAKREVENGKDLVILMDSLTRLARSYNIVIPSSGKIISGGLDPMAVYMPKKFFGAARNIDGAGSLTIIATALVDTGSRMDDVIYEEFKGTGNMELHLDRELADMRIFPAIDIKRSGTRREEHILDKDSLKFIWNMRKSFCDLSKMDTLKETIKLLKKSKVNGDLLKRFVD